MKAQKEVIDPKDAARKREVELFRLAVGKRAYHRLNLEIDLLMDQAFHWAYNAKKDDDPAVKMCIFLLGRIMPDVREQSQSVDMPSKTFNINIVGIERGTTESREVAVKQIQERRLQLEAREAELADEEASGD